MLFGRRDQNGRRKAGFLCHLPMFFWCEMSHCKCQRWRNEVRLVERRDDNTSSGVCLSSPLSLLQQYVSSHAVFEARPCASFLNATNILPRGQDLPLNMHASAHACMHSPPSPVLVLHARTHNPIASESLFQRDNWSEHVERREHQLTDLSMCQCSNYPISPSDIQ